MDVFREINPAGRGTPILISSPHSGTYFPESVRSSLRSSMLHFPDDTDWFIDELYDFAPSLGITMICANYSRWVIDLNRDPDQKPLYHDGRIITGLVPITDFNGNRLYAGEDPDDEEIGRRKKAYFDPYHRLIGEILQKKRQKFGQALLFDAHSIRKHVPGIQPEPFPDLIIGDNDGNTASKELSDKAIEILQQSGHELAYNHPFKGGYITRSFGKPAANMHALQLEMAKTNYMDDAQKHYDQSRASETRSVLIDLFNSLIGQLR